MASTVQSATESGVADLLIALAAGQGSASHPHAALLATPDAAARDIADAIHCLAMIHGRHPGVVDHVNDRNAHPQARDWLEGASAAFVRERALLATLVVAAGPLPSTPGQAESEATVTAQDHALAMLAQSDRAGCALGAALALALDWRAVRAILDAAASRLGVPSPALTLPPLDETSAVAAAVAERPAIERALGFGAQQMLVQHRGLWDLLESRAAARRDAV